MRERLSDRVDAVRRAAWLLGGAMAGLVVAMALGASRAAPTAQPGATQILAGETSLRFDAEVLADLGIALGDVVETSPSLRDGALGFALDVATSSVALDATGDDFEGFRAADLRHAGGFALSANGQRIDLAGFRMAETAPPRALELRDASGRRWFWVDRPHALLSSEALSLSNADVQVAPELAALLGRPDLAGTYIGVLDAELSLFRGAAAARSSAVVLGGSCVGDFTQPVDLFLEELNGMTQAARQAGVRVAMAPGATVTNLGPGDVQWFRSIAPASPLGPHPYLALHFYRLSNGVLEQVARGDLKHTFFATNTGCDCPSGQILYAGCSDLYGVSTNLDRINLAPRSEIDAHTLAWSSLGSHFDGTPVDDVRSHGGDSVHDSFQHRLVVREPDLQTVGARYFYDAWYMAPNDSDLGNSMAHREVAPSFAGSSWSFPTVDAGTANGSILDVFVDPGNVLPGQATELHDTGVGRVQLALVSNDLGGGVFHYEYALMNFDFERRIQSFKVPIGAGQTVSNAGFGDGDATAGNNWTPSVGADAVTWTAPAGNALDWGTLFNFRMDVNAAPGASVAVLTPLDPGSPALVGVHTLPEPGLGAGAASSLGMLALLARRRAARSRSGRA